MSLYRQFKTDKKVEKEGILLQYGKNERTSTDDTPKFISIRVARAGGANAAYDKLLNAKAKPHRRRIQTENFEKAEADILMMDVYAKTVVLGWENVDFEETENGPAVNDVPFNYENCIRLFKDLPDLFADIQEQCSKWALFRADIRDVESKN